MSDDDRRLGASPASGGPEHDAWLREALRHAPDAGAAPPPMLRDAILAEARAATRVVPARTAAPAMPSLLDRALAFWSWLARPQVAAGFASVMAATLVGMLWWDRPMDETMLPPPSAPSVAVAPRPLPDAQPAAKEKQQAVEEAARTEATAGRANESASAEKAVRDSATTAVPAATPTPQPAPAKVQAPRDSAELAAREIERRNQVARAATDEIARQSAEETKRAAKSAPAAAERKQDDRRAAPAAPAPTGPPAVGAATAPEALRPAAESPTPFPARSPAEAESVARPAPVTVPAPAAAPPTPAPAQGRAEPFALAKKAEQGEKDGSAAKARVAPPPPVPAAPPAPAPAPTPAPATAGAIGGALGSRDTSTDRLSAQNASPSSTRQRAAAPGSAAQPMAPLLAALASEDARWTRRGAAGDGTAIDAATRTWLAHVQAATASRWEAPADRSARRDAPSAAPAATLRLERDDRATASVRVEDGGVRFEAADGSAWFAPLSPEVVARLRATLPAPR